MASRLNLHEELKDILGNNNVYFQPPESIKLHYPCIIYKLVGGYQRRGDDKNYIFTKRYQVTLIHKNPDNDVVDKIVWHFKMCTFSNAFSNDGLNHYIFDLYY